MKLKKKELSLIKKKIISERDRVLDSLKKTDKEEFHMKCEDRRDEVDQATSEYERSQMLRFKKRDAFYVKKLNKALEKFETNEFGCCEECDEVIKFERLIARPTAELCISCKDESEREEQSNFMARQSKSVEKRADFLTSAAR